MGKFVAGGSGGFRRKSEGDAGGRVPFTLSADSRATSRVNVRGRLA